MAKTSSNLMKEFGLAEDMKPQWYWQTLVVGVGGSLRAQIVTQFSRKHRIGMEIYGTKCLISSAAAAALASVDTIRAGLQVFPGTLAPADQAQPGVIWENRLICVRAAALASETYSNFDFGEIFPAHLTIIAHPAALYLYGARDAAAAITITFGILFRYIGLDETLYQEFVDSIFTAGIV